MRQAFGRGSPGTKEHDAPPGDPDRTEKRKKANFLLAFFNPIGYNTIRALM